MSLFFSKSSEYAIQALITLALVKSGEYLDVHGMGATNESSKSYLLKILRRLARRGWLKSKKGRSGGYCLLKEPSQISLYEVVQLFDGEDLFEQCPLGLSKCQDEAPCPMHRNLKPHKEALSRYFLETSIEQLAQETSLEESVQGWFSNTFRAER